MRRLLLIFVLFGLLSACGGGGSDHETPASSGETTFFGIVEDGPVAGARVFLRDIPTGQTMRICGASGVGRCETVTDENGVFSLRVGGIPPDRSLEIFTSGGFDRLTGIDFSGISMRAPLALFGGRTEHIAVTPLTSVLSGRLTEGGTLTRGADDIALELGLPSGIDLGARIADDPRLLHPALLLTALALELAEAGDADPFASLGARLDGTFPLLTDAAGDPDFATLREWGFDEPAIARIGALNDQLRSGDGSLHDRFVMALLTRGLQETVHSLLEEVPGFDPGHPSLQSNLKYLARGILLAAGDIGLPMRGLPPVRISRYVLFTYLDPDGYREPEGASREPGASLRAIFDALATEPDLFPPLVRHPETGLPLSDDPRIAELAALKSLYAVSVPLIGTEIPGGDNARRIDYFYNSDVSPFHQAETLLAGVFDDQVRGPLLAEIARGKAEVGLIDDARALLETQIYLSEHKARGYYYLGRALARVGRLSEAVQALAEAEYYCIRYTAPKRAAIENADLRLIMAIGKEYRKAGSPEGAQRMTAHMETFVPYLNTLALYGRIIVATWQLADEHIAEGDIEAALPLLESMLSFAEETPPNVTAGKEHYKTRVFYLLETAKRYAQLDLALQVEGVWSRIRVLRAGDALTTSETWTYMPDVVELLYQLERQEEALELAALIPSPHAAKAYKMVATYEALHVGLESALRIVETHLSATTDKIEALTYFALNKSREYIALAFIENERLDEARAALDIAAGMVDTLETTTERNLYLQVVQRGYVKIADLYHLAGDEISALEMFARAEGAAASMAGLQNRVDSLIDIASGYHAIGRGEDAQALLREAVESMRAAVEIAPADLASLYNKLIGAALNMEIRDVVAELISLYADAARGIFDPQGIYTGNDHDKLAKSETDHLIRAAAYGRRLGEPDISRHLLLEAAETARRISVEQDRLEKLVGPNGAIDSIVSGLAGAGLFDEALDTVYSRKEDGTFFLPLPGRSQGLLAIAEVLAERDDFPGTSVASVDTDGDGRPDFFHPLATPEEILESGLILDDDCDGDGILDTFDRRPLFRDTGAQV